MFHTVLYPLIFLLIKKARNNLVFGPKNWIPYGLINTIIGLECNFTMNSEDAIQNHF